MLREPPSAVEDQEIGEGSIAARARIDPRSSEVRDVRDPHVRDPRPSRTSGRRRVLGLVGLLAVVGGSIYLAVGAAGGNYLLELPVRSDPGWIRGPLKLIAGNGQWLRSGQLSAGLIVLLLGYLLALGCAESISPRAALTAVVVANLVFTLGPTIVSTDVFGYIAYGRELALHGLDPYVSPPAAISHDGILELVYWKHQPSPYGPLFTFISAPLGLASGAVALWAFKAAAGLASTAIAFLLAATAARRGLSPARAAIFVGLNPAVLFYAVSGAHNDLLAVCLVVIGLALALRGMEARGAGAVVAGAAIKLTVGLALPFVVIAARRRGQALRGAALVALAIGIPALALFGVHFFDQLHRIATDPLFDTLFSGPDRLASALGTHITPAIRTLCTGVVALVALAAIVAAWRGHDPVTAAGWAFLALIAAIASFAPWYLVWVLPLAALGRSRRLRVAALLVTVYVMAVHIPALGGVPWLSQAPGSTGQTTRIADIEVSAAQRGSISSTLIAPASATRTSPVRGSTATVFG